MRCEKYLGEEFIAIVSLSGSGRGFVSNTFSSLWLNFKCFSKIVKYMIQEIVVICAAFVAERSESLSCFEIYHEFESTWGVSLKQ